MKKAFTVLELVFVIIIIGIIAVVVIPRTGSSKLREAAVQVLSHIRYTQHLAIMDNKFNSSGKVWYKKRWQIMFANTAGSGNSWSYMIFSDFLGSSTGTPDVNEHAVNPLNSSKLLTGGYSAGNIAFNDSRATSELNIGKKYGITNISFSNSCSISSSRRVAFDHLGRPLKGNLSSMTGSYFAGTQRLITQTCSITLTNNEGSVIIQIEPETGYAHIN